MHQKITMAALLLTMEQAYLVYGKHSDYRPLPESAPWHQEKREWRWHKPDYPTNYKVPDFGVDHDIAVSQNNLKDTEKLLKHQWSPKKNEQGAFVLPNSADAHSTMTYDPKARMQIARDEEYVQTESDPVCHSAGCTQYLHPKPSKKD